LAIVAGLVGVILVVGVTAWVSQDLPDPNRINSRVVAQSTKIYARDGSTLLYEIHGDQRRTVIELADIATFAKQATLSIEDKDFYKHSGFSLRGLMRAIFVDILSGHKAQGGSTITQQLVKNSILTREKSYIRKIKEIILSYQIEQRFSKDQILKMYFNEIPYGSNNYGIESAAESTFGKRAKDLDLAESALLAGMVQSPSYYSPRGIHTPELLDRQHVVLNEMARQGYITAAQAEEAKGVDVLKRVTPSRDPITAPHFVLTVRDQLVEKYGEKAVETGGMRVITTLNPDYQKIAEEEVTAGVTKIEKRYNASNAALVAVDAKTGQILAMVGSRDFFDTEHDGNFNVATAVRNPGSSFKPIVYLSAFTKGYSPDTLLFDLKTNFGPDGSGKDFIPNNYDLKDHGPLTMRKTLAGSLNVPAVKTLYLAGIPHTAELAGKLGYTTIDGSKAGLAMAIGGSGVRLVEHVGAFAALANDGTYNPITYILRIEDKNGKVLEQYKAQSSKAVDLQPVRQLQDVMSDNNARAYVFGTRNNLTLSDRSVAAKTGTTNDNRDGWTMGYTPSLAAGVWVGNNDYSPMKAGSDGSVVAAPIWHNFMQRALKGKPVEKFTKPGPNTSTKPILLGQLPGNAPITVDSESGLQIPDSCLATWPAQYVQHVVVKSVHDILYYVQKDDPNGAAPSNPSSDPMYTRWEAPVAAWAKKNGYVDTLPGYDTCGRRTGVSGPSISITSPFADQTISSSPVTVTVQASSPAGVTSVQYSLDGVAQTTSTEAPYSTTLDLSSVSGGFHTIQATITDAAGVTATASVRMNYLVGSVPTAYISSPTNKQSLALSSFPRTVTAVATDPDGVANVTLLTKNSDGTTTVINSLDNPSDATVSLPWPTPASGEYKLFITMRSKKSRVTTSDTVTVTVTP
jgi:membrane peptidoglycan carboxypeptidase